MSRSPRDRVFAALVVLGLALSVAILAWPLPRGAARLEGETTDVPGPTETPVGLQTIVDVSAPADATRRAETGDRGLQTLETAANGAGPPTGIVLHGVVQRRGVDATGWCWLRLTDADGATRSARIGASGEYAISGVDPGPWWCEASAQAHRPLAFAREVLASPRVQRLDLTLEASVVLKIKLVTPGGAPLLGELRKLDGRERWTPPSATVLPVATVEAPGEWFTDVLGSHNNPFGVGQFWGNGWEPRKLPPEYLGVVILACDPPVHVSAVFHHRVLATERVGPGVDEVAFVIEPDALLAELASVRFAVADAATGEPVEGARATLAEPGGYAVPRPLGADGTCSIERHAPGEFLLSAGAPGKANHVRRARIESGRVNDLGTLLLEPGLSLSGRVVGPGGEGVEAYLALARPGREPGTLAAIDADVLHRTRPDGSFAVAGLSAGRYLLRTGRDPSPQGPSGPCLASPVVEVDAGASDVVLAAVPCASVAFALRVADAEGWRLVVLDDAGRVARETRWWSGGPLRIELPPGAYTARAAGPDGRQHAEASFAAGAGVARVELVPAER